MRPWVRGLCPYEALTTPGRLSLVDVALMNEALDVTDENAARAQAAARAARDR